ncbi:MAG: hypothetical protein ABIQ95_10680, partial [Bdellovibrionia bacterium]
QRSTTVVVSKFPTEFSILGFSSINFNALELNEDRILKAIKGKTYTGAYIFQDIEKITGKPRVEESLATHAFLRLIKQVSISPRHELRISELQNL